MKQAIEDVPYYTDKPSARRRMAELEVELMALEYTNFRTVAATDEGKPFGPESSGLKIKGTELQQKMSQAMVEMGGLMSLAWDSPSVVGNESFNNAPRRYNFYVLVRFMAAQMRFKRMCLPKCYWDYRGR